MDDSGTTPGAPGQRPGTDLAAALGALSQAVSHEGGYDNIVSKLRAAGFDVQVDSWVSTGANEPIGPQQFGQAIGPGMVQRLSASSTIDVTALLPLLASFLPQMINMLTPDGTTPTGGLDAAVRQGGAPGLGDLLAGALGGEPGASPTAGATDQGDLDSRLGRLAGPGGWDKGR